MNSMNRLAAAVIAVAIAAALLALPVAASAAGRVYWTDNTKQLPFAALDGSGGGLLPLSGGTLSYPRGLAIDSAASRIYWVGESGEVSVANLDGSGRTNLNTTGATFNQPFVATIDPVARRIYWANSGSISYASLDGSGGGTLNTGSAPVFAARALPSTPWQAHLLGRVHQRRNRLRQPRRLRWRCAQHDWRRRQRARRVAIDPVSKRLFWSNDEVRLRSPMPTSMAPAAVATSMSPAATPCIRAVSRSTPKPAHLLGRRRIARLDLLRRPRRQRRRRAADRRASVQYMRLPILQNPPHVFPCRCSAALRHRRDPELLAGRLGRRPGALAALPGPEQLLLPVLRDGAEVARASTASYVPTARGPMPVA